MKKNIKTCLIDFDKDRDYFKILIKSKTNWKSLTNIWTKLMVYSFVWSLIITVVTCPSVIVPCHCCIQNFPLNILFIERPIEYFFVNFLPISLVLQSLNSKCTSMRCVSSIILNIDLTCSHQHPTLEKIRLYKTRYCKRKMLNVMTQSCTNLDEW